MDQFPMVFWSKTELEWDTFWKKFFWAEGIALANDDNRRFSFLCFMAKYINNVHVYARKDNLWWVGKQHQKTPQENFTRGVSKIYMITFCF